MDTTGKRVVSVSIGSSRRNHSAQTELFGQCFEVSRVGTDGSVERAKRLLREQDGAVDAFGVGGTDFYVQVGERRYELRDGRALRAQVKRSKIGDGSAVKHILEARLVRAVARRVPLAGRRAFHTSAVDRYGMALALEAEGCDLVLGDFITSLGLPFPVRSIATIERTAPLVLPWLLQLPTSWVYPVGAQQEKAASRRLTRYARDAEVISGDFHQIRRVLPDDLTDKIVITNTTTPEDVQELRRRGLGLLATSTPRLGGRSFGTNVIEAMLLAMIDKPQDQITPADLEGLIQEANIEGSIEQLS